MSINQRLIDTNVPVDTTEPSDGSMFTLRLDANDVDSYDSYGTEWIDIKDHEYSPTTNVSEHFNTVTYTGNNGNNNSITGAGFQPDLVWIKTRTTALHHVWMDSLRGASSIMGSSFNSAPSALGSSWRAAYGEMDSFDTDGFTVSNGSGTGNFNSGIDYVAWCFKAGGAPSGSDKVSIDGTSSANEAAAGLTAGTAAVAGLSANTDLGFSIATIENVSGAFTFSHGLDVSPELVILKTIGGGPGGDASGHWYVYSKDLQANKYLVMNSTAAAGTSANIWQNTRPTNDVASVHYSGSSYNFAAYSFASKRGVSKVGGFEGNGGTKKVYTGFEPAFILFKNADNGNGNSAWFMYDNKRGDSEYLMANSNSMRGTDAPPVEFHRDGFSVNYGGGAINVNNQTHIYYAAAKNTNEASLIADTNLELHLDAASFPEYGEAGYSQYPTTWTDSSGSNDGTIIGSAKFDSELGNYLDFDGSNDYISFSQFNISSNNKVTVELWVNPNSTQAQYANMLDYGHDGTNGFTIQQNSNTTNNYWIYNSGIVATVSIEPNKWTHLCITGDGTSFKTYINGELEQTGTAGSAAGTSGRTLNIGRWRGGASRYWNGQMGQVRFYGSSLTQAQVRQNFNFTKPSYPNGTNGTIVDATWNSGGYFNFDQNRITLPSAATAAFDTVNRTLSIWIYVVNNNGYRIPIVIQGSNLNYGMLYFELNMSASTVKYQMGYGTVSTSFSLNTWHHLAVVQQDASSEAFFDGVSVGTAASGNNSIAGTQFQMGGLISTTSLDFKGRISKLSLYSGALTQTEITALYDEGR